MQIAKFTLYELASFSGNLASFSGNFEELRERDLGHIGPNMFRAPLYV